MKHFLYKTTNIINNKFYYGIHSTDDINDGYIGSGKLLSIAIKKYGRKNFLREIIEFFDTREAALCRENEIITEELLLDENCYNITWGGLAGEMFYVTVKNSNGEIFHVTKDDPRYLSGELVGINSGMVNVKNSNGEIFHVTKDDPRYLSGELVGVCKNTVTVKDTFGNKFRVTKDDPRYLSGELVGVATDCAMKGKIVVVDSSGNKYIVTKDDPRYLSGELIHTSKNTHWVNNGIEEKMILFEEIQQYKNNGWILGRIKKCWIHTDYESKMVFEHELNKYIINGWILGRGKVRY